VLQIGTPTELYERPQRPFVATFVGDADLVRGDSDGTRVTTPVGSVPVVAGGSAGAVDVVVRPESVRLRLDGSGPGSVSRITYYGHDQVIEVALVDGGRVRARTGPGNSFHPGDRVAVQVVGDVVVFPSE
jgi:ABC-type Fe3+/spermidine/putrescine transport system ATPase subunit